MKKFMAIGLLVVLASDAVGLLPVVWSLSENAWSLRLPQVPHHRQATALTLIRLGALQKRKDEVSTP